jgi:hypothetical protein
VGYVIFAAWLVIPISLYALYLFLVKHWSGFEKDSSDQPPTE